jgi:hypothetical protein
MKYPSLLPSEAVESLTARIDAAESGRDAQSIERLRAHVDQHLPMLLPLTHTLTDGVFERLIHYLGNGEADAKQRVREKYKTLWTAFLQDNTAGLAGLLLARDVILSQMLLDFCDEKLVRFFAHATSKDGRLMEAIHARYLKSLRMFQKVNGKLASLEIHMNHINIGGQALGAP